MEPFPLYLFYKNSATIIRRNEYPPIMLWGHVIWIFGTEEQFHQFIALGIKNYNGCNFVDRVKDYLWKEFSVPLVIVEVIGEYCALTFDECMNNWS